MSSATSNMQKLYNLLSQVPEGILLRVGELGVSGNICLDFMSDGEAVGPCPLVEITPDGELVEQVASVETEVGPIEALQAELGQ